MTLSTYRVLALAGILGAAPLTSSAELLSYEPFNYAGGARLEGQVGGSGWSSPWSLSGGQTNSPDILAGSLTYTDPNGVSLPTAGGRALVDSTNLTAGAVGDTVAGFRGVNGVLSEVTGSTIYISFVGQQTQGTQRFINLALFGTALQEIVAIGTGDDFGEQKWGAYRNGVGGQGGYSNTAATNLSFLVLRLDLNIAGSPNDRFRLYVNPILGAEPGTAAVDVADYDLFSSFSVIDLLRICAGSSNADYGASQMQIDELRLADTYASAAPIPEPSTAMLLGGALALLPLHRARRHSAIR